MFALRPQEKMNGGFNDRNPFYECVSEMEI